MLRSSVILGVCVVAVFACGWAASNQFGDIHAKSITIEGEGCSILLHCKNGEPVLTLRKDDGQNHRRIDLLCKADDRGPMIGIRQSQPGSLFDLQWCAWKDKGITELTTNAGRYQSVMSETMPTAKPVYRGE